MDANFWHERWEKNELGFHESEFNTLMVKHFNQLPNTSKSRVFIPLCGKSLDMHWLLKQGFKIVGCELSELAVTQFFEEMKITPTIAHEGSLKHFHYENIDIYAGDIFELSVSKIGKIDAIYDRGALVALPLEMRIRYCGHIRQITENAPQLVLTFEYDTTLLQGPPFAIFEDDLKLYYQSDYQINLVDRIELKDGLKGHSPVQECAWILNPT